MTRELLHDVIEDRRQEDSEDRNAEHSGEDRDAEREAHFATRAGSGHQRNDAQNERERRHNDRAQTQTAGFQRRGETALALFDLRVFGKLDDQNRVFTRQTDQDEKADLRKDVHIEFRKVDADKRAEQTHRNDQHDRERKRPALVKRGQQKEYEQNGKTENVNRGVPGALFEERELRPFVPDGIGKRFVEEVFHRFDRFAGAGSLLHLEVQRRRREHVETLDRQRPGRVFRGNEGAERRHFAEVVANEDAVNILRFVAVLRIALNLHLERAV